MAISTWEIQQFVVFMRKRADVTRLKGRCYVVRNTWCRGMATTGERNRQGYGSPTMLVRMHVPPRASNRPRPAARARFL